MRQAGCRNGRALLLAAIVVLSILLGTAGSRTRAAAEAGFLWVTEEDGITITGTFGARPSRLVIPDEIEGQSVTRLGSGAFRDDIGIVEVVLPASLKEIGDETFRGCTMLASVQGGSGIVSIGREAFSFCEALTSLTLPAGLKEIGEYAFWHCSALSSASVPGGVTRLPAGVFGSCRALSSLILPDTLEEIGELALAGTALPTLEVPQAVRSIGDSAFTGCGALQSLSLPPGLREIPAYMASDCGVLETVMIPDSVRRIGQSAFSHCTSLQRVTIPTKCEEIGELAFWACRSLQSVRIPNGMEEIAYGTFWDCLHLGEVTIPKSIAVIDAMVFYRTSLRDVYYAGTEAQWRAIEVAQYGYMQTGAVVMDSNAVLASAQIHFGTHDKVLPDGVSIRAYSALWVDEISSLGMLLRGLEAGRPASGTTSANLLGQFIIPPTVAAGIVSVNKEELLDSDVVGTGDVLVMEEQAGRAAFKATIIVTGDVLGTGTMSLSQLVRAAGAFSGTRPLSGAFLLAADFDGNGRVDLTDMVREAQLLAVAKETANG